MGSRKDDPYCDKLGNQNIDEGMVAASDTHKGYPDFLRLNPIINWNYDQVWTFIRDFQVPYCPLYDEGNSYLTVRLYLLGQQAQHHQEQHSLRRKQLLLQEGELGGIPD
jgi:3'-phosphoadenosine 5'-phosphosulfate sulfotransferase (PAPS reductase)/FAD synthetase